MARKRSLALSRWTVGVVKAAMMLTAAGVTGLSVSDQDQREWRDYAGGPDSSRFVAAKQVTKSNVNQLQVVWTYAAGQTDFNPLVVRGVIRRGANGAFVALDAATGNQIWIHEGVQGFNSRGIKKRTTGRARTGRTAVLIFELEPFPPAIDARTGMPCPAFGDDGQAWICE